MKRFIGIIIVLAGIAVLLNNLGFFEIKNFYSIFWASLMLTLGVFGIISKRKFDIIYVLLIVLGLLFVLANVGVITFKVVEVALVPAILIVVGISLLVNISKPKNKNDKGTDSYVAIFGGVEEVHKDDNYVKSDITTIFGGADIDYRSIKFKNKKGYIYVTSIFGGVNIRVPSNVRVVTKGIPIFGGVENKMKNVESDEELIIEYNVIFGGIEIKD